MSTPPVYRQPLDGSEMVRVLKDGRWYLAPVTALAALYDASALTARLSADEAALATEISARTGAVAAEATARHSGDTTLAANLAVEAGTRSAADAGEISARTAADTAAVARISAIEARPEEVAHFTASAKLPALSALAPVTLVLTGLVPARAGDALKIGETIEVEPATLLPPGISRSAAVVTADGTVSLQLTASLSIAAGSAALVWNITALR